MLEEKATAATAHHNELSAKIKAAEKRMAEIAILRPHIVNYAKTCETYVAYRKAGFRQEHEEEILLHQAAKILGTSIATLDAARSSGLISYVQYAQNGCVYFTDAGLQEYIAKCTHLAKLVEKSTTYRKPRSTRV